MDPYRALIESYERLLPPRVPGPPATVKLTQAQLDLIPRAPTPHPWDPDALAAALTGIPVELVDTVEESTPYQEGWL